MRTLIFIVHLCVVFEDCQLMRTPSNTALLVGQRLELMCQTDASYKVREWSSQLPFSSNLTKIFNHWSAPKIVGSSRFGYIIDNNSITLYLNSTELDDAGIYDCSVQQGSKQLEHYNAQLIVFETEPVCESNITTSSNDTLEEGSVVWMRCSLNFRGNLAPTMEWQHHRRNGDMESRVITKMVEPEIIPNANISSTLIVIINGTYNASIFTCKTYFQWDNTSSTNSTATNAPDYSYTWNSSAIFVSSRKLVQKKTATASATTSIITSEDNGSFMAFNAIYLVAGVAVLFGVASSLVALIQCHRLRKKNSAAAADLDRMEPLTSDYDMIPYAVTDSYDTIEEVEEKDDILATQFSPRVGPLPSPNYSGLAPVESKPPGVYSRIEHKKQSVDDGESGVEGDKLHLNEYASAPDYLKLSDEKDLDPSKRYIGLSSPSNNYLSLSASDTNDSVNDSEEIPSAYLKISDSPLHFTESNAKVIATGEHPSRIPTVCPNPYLELSAEVDKDSVHPSSIPTVCPNPYLELSAEVDKDSADDNEELSSTYLTIRDESSQSNNANKNTKETILADEIPSTYLNPRDFRPKSSR